MADISTAVSMARVPILGEDGRISDDYIPAAIGENVTKAEAAATRAETAATGAEGSASAASRSATQASGSALAASESASQAQQSAATASGAATSAQSAQTAAEAAQSAAAGSARDAQQSASAAAQSAASVADKYITSAKATTLEPGSQATASVADQVLTIGVPKGDKGDKGEQGDPGTGVPEGGTPGQLLSKTEDGTAWVDPPSTGNVLTGEAEGYVAHADDAYAQKPIEVRVKGRTVKNLWPAINKSFNGITISTDDTGLVTVSGTATASFYYSTPIDGIAPNKNYALLISSNVRSSVPVMVQTIASGSYSELVSNAAGTTDTSATPTSFDSAVAAIQVSNGTTVNASFRVMLVEGSEAPDCFTPPASITSVQTGNLVTAGKNLLNEDAPSSDGVVGPQLPPGDYALSGTLPSGASLKILNGGADGETITDASSLPHTFTAGHPFTPYYAGMGGYATGLMLELGSTATAYEPPNVTETALPEVELRSLPDGTCDELVINSDGTCRVERRTQLSGDEVTALPEPTTEPQSPVSLPQLPAPTFNAYHDSKVPSDTSVEYERDINIALERLEAKMAALNVAQATS